MSYEGTTLVVLEGNCGGEVEEFIEFVETKHPEIKIDFLDKCIGGGLFGQYGELVENCLWDDYCNQ